MSSSQELSSIAEAIKECKAWRYDDKPLPNGWGNCNLRWVPSYNRLVGPDFAIGPSGGLDFTSFFVLLWCEYEEVSLKEKKDLTDADRHAIEQLRRYFDWGLLK